MFVLLACLALVSSSRGNPDDRQGRGFFSDMVDMWGGISETIDDIQEKAAHEVQNLKPMLKEADMELDQAMASVKTSFDTLADSLASAVDSAMERDDLVIGADHEVTASKEDQEIPLFKIPDFMKTFNLNNMFGNRRRGVWYEGPNVCITKEVIEDEATPAEVTPAEGQSRMFKFSSTFRSCSQSATAYECKTTTKNDVDGETTIIERHQCCFGYARSESECVKVEDMEPLKETIKDLEANGFVDLVDSLDLNDLFQGNRTVFVPSNDAVEDFQHDLETSNAITSEESVRYNVDDGFGYRRKGPLKARS